MHKRFSHLASIDVSNTYNENGALLIKMSKTTSAKKKQAKERPRMQRATRPDDQDLTQIRMSLASPLLSRDLYFESIQKDGLTRDEASAILRRDRYLETLAKKWEASQQKQMETPTEEGSGKAGFTRRRRAKARM